MIYSTDLDNWFTYHAPSEERRVRYALLRDAAKLFASSILMLTPAGADQADAIRKVREAVMMANAAIACGTNVVSTFGFGPLRSAADDMIVGLPATQAPKEKQ